MTKGTDHVFNYAWSLISRKKLIETQSSIQTQSWTYDARNHLVSYSNQGQQIATYQVNALGQRTLKTVQNTGENGITHFHYNPQGQLIQTDHYALSGEQQSTQHILWLDQLPIALIETRYQNGQTSEAIYYLTPDHLGTPRLATDHNQRIVWFWQSDAFGTTPPNQDPDGDGILLSLNLRFPGQYADHESIRTDTLIKVLLSI